jgi:hypothetical protein
LQKFANYGRKKFIILAPDLQEIMTELRSFHGQIEDTREFINTYQARIILNQGTQTEGEGSVHSTSSLR